MVPGSSNSNVSKYLRDFSKMCAFLQGGPLPVIRGVTTAFFWPWKWVTVVLTLLIIVVAPFVTSRGAHLVGFCHIVTPLKV